MGDLTVIEPIGDVVLASEAVKTMGDTAVIESWLGSHESGHTQKNYRRVALAFFQFVRVPLAAVQVGHIQDYINGMEGKASTRALHTAAIKSMFKYAKDLGRLEYNPAASIKVPKTKKTVAERIMSKSEATRIIYAVTGRNHVLLKTMYLTGARVSEVVGLCWRDLSERDNGQGQLTLYGKGGKTRAVLVSAELWEEIQALPKGLPDSPVFMSRKGGALTAVQVHRIIKDAATAAGLEKAPSAHWFRHSHATHALEGGAPLHLVQQTLGHSSLAITGMYLHARPNESSGKYLAI